jgi:hypothetical protein
VPLFEVGGGRPRRSRLFHMSSRDNGIGTDMSILRRLKKSSGIDERKSGSASRRGCSLFPGKLGAHAPSFTMAHPRGIGSRLAGRQLFPAPGCGAGPFACGSARIQHEFCPLTDLIAGTRNLSGNFPVDGAPNPQSRHILYMRECRAGVFQRAEAGAIAPPFWRHAQSLEEFMTEGTTLIGNTSA